MSEDIYVSITGARSGSIQTVATNILVQLDTIEAPEKSTFQGADPGWTYKCLTTMLPISNPELILSQDHMIDRDIIDPHTLTNRKYLIISDPTPFPDYHWEWTCTRQRGT
jgi:hypothetical protein